MEPPTRNEMPNPWVGEILAAFVIVIIRPKSMTK